MIMNTQMGKKKKKKHNKHIFKDLFLEGNNYNKCFEFNFKQTINHTSNIVSTNKSWKLFK